MKVLLNSDPFFVKGKIIPEQGGQPFNVNCKIGFHVDKINKEELKDIGQIDGGIFSNTEILNPHEVLYTVATILTYNIEMDLRIKIDEDFYVVINRPEIILNN